MLESRSEVSTDSGGAAGRSRQFVWLATGAVAVIIVVLMASGAGGGPLTAMKAVVLGVVEGVTEFLPVSSTGHLLMVERLLDLGSDRDQVALDTYTVAIQLGAILAVVHAFRRQIVAILRGAVGRDRVRRRPIELLAVAFVPAGIIGVVAGDAIKDELFSPWPIIAAWVIGGIVLLRWRPRAGSTRWPEMSWRAALVIGLAQSLALWPGVSRSLATIVASLAVGCSMAAAVEFSFLLGLATLTAATAYDLAKHGSELVDAFGVRTPVLGALAAFASAMLAVQWFVGYLRTRPLTVFGWYRLGIAALCAALVVGGAI